MSFSNNTTQTNPSAKWFEWNGEEGHIVSFDKSQKESENKGKIKTNLPFKFILLDATSTVKGFSEENGFIYCNEVKDTTTQPLFVRAHKGKLLASGIYSTIKDKLATLKCKFYKNIYIVRKNENKSLELCTLQLRGAALAAWSQFCKDNKIYFNTCHKPIIISSSKNGKKGSIEFKVPVFNIVNEDLKDIVKEEATKLDKSLQEYFVSYFNRKVSDSNTEPPQPQMPEVEPEEESFPNPTLNQEDDF